MCLIAPWHVDLSRPGIKLVSSALAGGFWTTGPPGKPRAHLLQQEVWHQSGWLVAPDESEDSLHPWSAFLPFKALGHTFSRRSDQCDFTLLIPNFFFFLSYGINVMNFFILWMPLGASEWASDSSYIRFKTSGDWGNQIWKRQVHPNFHHSTVYNSQDMEAT